jgi:hypothetical protein
LKKWRSGRGNFRPKIASLRMAPLGARRSATRHANEKNAVELIYAMGVSSLTPADNRMSPLSEASGCE